MQPRSIILNCTAGTSNKTYRIQLVQRASGWCVDVQRGAIGKTLIQETKTPTPVEFAKAAKLYDKLVKEKLAKQYVPEAGDFEVTQTPGAGTPVDLPVMLLNPVSESEATSLVTDPAWCAEIKHDGMRMLLVIEDGQAYGVNRRKLKVALPAAVRDAALAYTFNSRTVLDGECIGDRFVVFDVIVFDGADITTMPYSWRMDYRAKVAYRLFDLEYTRTATTTQDKADLIAKARENVEEGVVWKRLDARYVDGRPNSGGPMRKWKFVESATVRVRAKHPSKRSVQVEVIDAANGLWTEVGYVTVPPNKDIPAPGAVVEVQYLYFAVGSLYQPVYLGIRTDLTDAACRSEQLKLVAERNATTHLDLGKAA
ncbi:RNA ligase family protein [Luteimonas sp. MHLX1A]|uniref:RNA ligase family protein n=1 Tax=Alterluteimonas muca TaxID=2878684 RepID=UPI001E6083B2|nr:RNA ligase family protein [Luteimonas sp. MHLX1A]MCD9046760.1 hypothetical protein [Luteimonas sp. MHLX1A]